MCRYARVCLSKGLGAPVGSVIVGTTEFIAKCRRLRKACGGTMRQAGVLAAAALMAMKEIHPVLHLDHLRMNELAAGLGKIDGRSGYVCLMPDLSGLYLG